MAFTEDINHQKDDDENKPDENQTSDRKTQIIKGSWINNLSLGAFFLLIAIYFASDFKMDLNKKKAVIKEDWSIPVEGDEDWQRYKQKPKTIIEKMEQQVTNKQDDDIQESKDKREKKEPVYEPFIYKAYSEKKIDKKTNSRQVAMNRTEPSQASKSDYVDKVMDGVAKLNKSPEQNKETLNEQLEVKLLEKTYAIQETNLDRKVLQGKLIPAILDFSMHTALPGKVRAYTSENFYSQNGARLLANSGSLLTGSYRGGMDLGIERLFIIWERLVTTEGQIVELGSPVIGNLGRSGLNVEIDSHFADRFGASIFLSILNGGVSVLGGIASDGSNQTVQDIQANLNKSSEMALEQSLKIKPTGHRYHGAEIMVYVARDIEFPESIFEGTQ